MLERDVTTTLNEGKIYLETTRTISNNLLATGVTEMELCMNERVRREKSLDNSRNVKWVYKRADCAKTDSSLLNAISCDWK